jgi:hypothetical protein
LKETKTVLESSLSNGVNQQSRRGHPNYSDAGYLRAVEAAFENWEAMQKAGR